MVPRDGSHDGARPRSAWGVGCVTVRVGQAFPPGLRVPERPCELRAGPTTQSRGARGADETAITHSDGHVTQSRGARGADGADEASGYHEEDQKGRPQDGWGLELRGAADAGAQWGGAWVRPAGSADPAQDAADAQCRATP